MHGIIIRYCAYEMCAKRMEIDVSKKNATQRKYCSGKCCTYAGMVRHRRSWNRRARIANQKARDNWTPERRQRHIDYCKQYRKEKAHELKLKRCLT